MIKFTQSSRRSLFTGEIIGSKFIESQNMLMALCRQKVTKHIVECASFLQHWLEMVLLHYLLTMIILRGQSDTTRLQLQFKQVSLCQKNCICMDLIQNWDSQNQQANSIQMRHTLSKLNNQHPYTCVGHYLYLIQEGRRNKISLACDCLPVTKFCLWHVWKTDGDWSQY